MPSRDEALDSAAALLRKTYPEKTESLVMLPEKSVEHPYGWVIAFDWKEHIETGDWLLSPITSVVVVPHDGGKAHFPPSAFPVDDYMSRRASGNWPPKE
ncbi:MULTISPECIES: YrhB domain-containing protein [unclassified Streptomyces]|uniref:YrhB domain-containing protein n=1 Tax=unclassified Streptomyces TaxID=2593676 RepID=UPI0007090926|nr:MULTISPECIES: YrhB domain-containing protein [unclassified Streptomyces]KRC95892.1 serine protease [Streptomyces sp. Root264]